jgi:hypothetical protein
VDASEIGVVEAYEAQHGVTAKERTRTLAGLGWTVDKFLENAPRASTSAAPDAERQTLLLQCSRSVRMRIARSHAVRVDMRAVGLATGGFDESRRVGSGGFGAVYAGAAPAPRARAGAAEPRCPPGTLEQFGDVAIKRHLRGAGQGDAEFVKELDVLAQLRDPRLVHLLAYAADEHERVLVSVERRGCFLAQVSPGHRSPVALARCSSSSSCAAGPCGTGSPARASTAATSRRSRGTTASASPSTRRRPSTTCTPSRAPTTSPSSTAT